MKRLISLSMVLIFAFTFCFATSADTADNNVVTVDNYTIVFDESSSLTQEEKLHMAQLRANYSPETSTESSTYGVMCTLFGHKTTTEMIIVTEHCVSATAPRCLETYEDLTVCSRCDYTTVEVISSIYIYCCD